jgi:hypothetical protein
VSEQCKIITPLGFATGLRLNHAEYQPIKSNQEEINCQQLQMLNGQYIQLSVNRASTTFGLASWKLHGLCGNITP